MKAKSIITAEMFEEATGHEHQQDDLERSNCPKAGESGHEFCGWNYEANLPCFMKMDQWTKDKMKARSDACWEKMLRGL